MNVLDLEEFNVIEGWDSEEYYKFVVEAKEPPVFCTLCGSFIEEGQHFKVHDKRPRTVADVDLRGKKVVIDIIQKRYKCPNCGDNFTEYFKSIERNDRVTQRLFKRMGEDSIKGKNTFKSIAEQHGVTDTTVKRAFWQHVDELYRGRVLIAPRVLGIDEVYLHEEGVHRKQPYAVFTDIENNEIIEFLAGNSKELVIDVIKQMKGYENIEIVAMDMNSGYRSAVKETIPDAYCVVDHFHVIQKANMRLNEIRAKIQNKLNKGEKKELYKVKWLITSNRENLDEEAIFRLDSELEKYERLHTAYWLKEGLRDVYKQKTKYDAFQQYFKWEQSFPPKGANEMRKVQKMIEKIKQEVFAYFDGRITNAYTESFNNVIKRIVRLGVGYSYDVLRAKILFGTKATEVKKLKDMNFNRIFNELARKSGKVIWTDPNSEYAENYSYRVNIDDLLQAMEEGEL
ncbi:ISL3 family transposase [Sutcliffiella horikoshii]|uniref:ISL3 family transposase n=1 Tax=Sutcliffiella horikoshii TaxID=79883 RepID=A0A5D4SWK0_9BACI|nr:ISL3 family transposase [Sutcliffiella horikoshii]TYS67041.1 ISL3 family transposase [Sutcliffiella horikoshii]